MNNGIRAHNRAWLQLRPIQLHYDVFGYGAASLLFQLGNTKVNCSVSLQQGVPPFLKGKKTGWLTAEYAMLPQATVVRTQRDGMQHKNGRNVEISRLIGRCLRSVTNCAALGEHTITVDCDVLQADGGTRTACITAACLALYVAQQRWLAAGTLHTPILKDMIAAISIGVINNQPLLDLDFAEDSLCDADLNFVLSKSGDIVEMQGTAEKNPLAWSTINDLYAAVRAACQELCALVDHPETVRAVGNIDFTKRPMVLPHFIKMGTPSNSAHPE